MHIHTHIYIHIYKYIHIFIYMCIYLCIHTHTHTYIYVFIRTHTYNKSSRINRKIFKTDYHVKTIEQVYGINKEFETCYLLSSPIIKAHRKQGHNFLHIGLVQVGVKPLIREGLNSSILMALRDTHYIRFNDSLLGTIETGLSGGLVHFNCFPNFTVHLHDPHVMKALTLNIKTHGTLMV